MNREYFKDEYIRTYLDSELDYLDREEAVAGYDKLRDADRLHLQSLDEEDLDKIADLVLDDNELNDKINETIHYYLYHYQKEGE